jgi:hypothetical protein
MGLEREIERTYAALNADARSKDVVCALARLRNEKKSSNGVLKNILKAV